MTEYNCTNCNSELILCPADYPFYPDIWICPNDCQNKALEELTKQAQELDLGY